MKRTAAILVGLIAFASASISAQEPPAVRPHDMIATDATWAQREAEAKIKSDGLQGLIAEIKSCYATTKPVYRCVYLDAAGAEIDSKMAKELGLPHAYTDDFFNPDIGGDRWMPLYRENGYSERQGVLDVTDALLVEARVASNSEKSPSSEQSIQPNSSIDPIAYSNALRACTSVWQMALQARALLHSGQSPSWVANYLIDRHAGTHADESVIKQIVADPDNYASQSFLNGCPSKSREAARQDSR